MFKVSLGYYGNIGRYGSSLINIERKRRINVRKVIKKFLVGESFSKLGSIVEF